MLWLADSVCYIEFLKRYFKARWTVLKIFYRGLSSYKDGFGSPSHELWLGNDKIYYITNHRDYQLRIDLVDRNGSPFYAKYNLFRISDENDKYKMVGLGSFTPEYRFERLCIYPLKVRKRGGKKASNVRRLGSFRPLHSDPSDPFILRHFVTFFMHRR